MKQLLFFAHFIRTVRQIGGDQFNSRERFPYPFISMGNVRGVQKLAGDPGCEPAEGSGSTVPVH